MKEIKRNLTDKERVFIHEYMKDLNAAAACRRTGYSAQNSDKIGHQLLGKTRVREEVDKLLAERLDKNNIDVDRVLDELSLIAFSRIDKILENIRNEDYERPEMAAVKRFKYNKSDYHQLLEVALLDKVKALELLGRYLGMFDRSKNHVRSERGFSERLNKRVREALLKRSKAERL
jgi:phage terminase small subunit